MSEPQDTAKMPPSESREVVPLLVGVAVSLVYVVAITVVVVGLLRFVQEYVRRPPAQELSPRAMLARFPFRR